VSRQLGLLDGPEFSEQQLEALLTPLYPPLWVMIDDPFQDLVKRRATDAAFRILKEGESAQWLRPQIVQRARDLCLGVPDLEVREHRNQVFLNYRNEIAITPKKYKRKWMSRLLTFSSYETPQNKNYWFQRPLDGFPRIPRIIVGYLFVKEMTEIKIFVAYPRGKELHTCYLMPDQSQQEFKVFARPFEAHELVAEEKGFSAKPKKSAAKRVEK
jgi:hypothetical protein